AEVGAVGRSPVTAAAWIAARDESGSSGSAVGIGTGSVTGADAGEVAAAGGAAGVGVAASVPVSGAGAGAGVGAAGGVDATVVVMLTRKPPAGTIPSRRSVSSRVGPPTWRVTVSGPARSVCSTQVSLA